MKSKNIAALLIALSASLFTVSANAVDSEPVSAPTVEQPKDDVMRICIGNPWGDGICFGD